MLIDNKLTWSHNINHIKLKRSNGIAILTKLRRFISRETLRMSFFTFVQPHIDYDVLVWRDETTSFLKLTQSKLKEGIRKMSFKKNRHAGPEPELVFRHHKILNF